MCTSKSCGHADSAKTHSLPRAAAALVLITLGVAISLHLRASHFSHWWMPVGVAAVVVHGAIVGTIAWGVARLRRGHPAPSAHPDAGVDSHGHEHSKVLHTPRSYDWLVRVLTLGGERKFRRRILDIAELGPGETVLDVGCGTGTLLIEAARRMGSGGSVHGVELSSEMLAHARRKAEGLIDGANLVPGSADRLPFPDTFFDVVLCTMVLHHLPPAMQVAAVGEMRRVVRPGGRIVLVDMQRPRTMSAALSLVTLFHNIGTHATAPDWENIESAMKQQGIEFLGRHALWKGSVSALVARIPA